MKYRQRHVLEITVFICGAAVMILELVASRVLAPYFGLSIFVWTSLIGIILGSLSLGYWWGGKLADKNPNYRQLALIVFLCGIFINLLALFKEIVLSTIQHIFSDIRIGVIVSTLILLTPPSLLLAIIPPYATKLKIKTLKTSGKVVGNLYAVSTIGSIIGTFLTGFFLLSYFGNTKILLLLSLLVLINSLVIYPKSGHKRKVMMIILFLVSFCAISFIDNIAKLNGFIDVDSQYNRIWIYKTKKKWVFNKTGRLLQILTTGLNGVQSAMFIDNPEELVFDCLKFYRLARHFNPQLKKSLMIGGGGYSYARDYLNHYPNATLDVVEIDPKLTELANRYFNLKDNPRLTIHHLDGRLFVDKTANKYDAMFIDVFNGYTPPYQLTTQEFIKKIYRSLNNEGIVLVNIISAIKGENGKLLRAEYFTYKSVFPSVYIFPVQSYTNGYKIQNIIIVASKSNNLPLFENKDRELNKYLKCIWTEEIKQDVPILTDDYSPVDYYTTKIESTTKHYFDINYLDIFNQLLKNI